MQIKIISGDDPSTVSAIARRCHLLDYEKYIDVSSLSDEEIKEAVEKYTIFGRVSPQQKNNDNNPSRKQPYCGYDR